MKELVLQDELKNVNILATGAGGGSGEDHGDRE